MKHTEQQRAALILALHGLGVERRLCVTLANVICNGVSCFLDYTHHPGSLAEVLGHIATQGAQHCSRYDQAGLAATLGHVYATYALRDDPAVRERNPFIAASDSMTRLFALASVEGWDR